MYRIYGLRFSAGIECPSLLPADGDADVTVRFDALPPLADPSEFVAEPGRLAFEVDGVARFQISDGNEIVVDRVNGVSDEVIRGYLLGSCLGVVLHQRGVLPLHTSAVRSQRGYVLLAGSSGCGKSTIAAALAEHGWPTASDDTAAITVRDGRPSLEPGYPERRLWPDSLDEFGYDPAELERVAGEPEKRRVPVTSFASEPGPIDSVFVLTTSDTKTATAERLTRPGVIMTALKFEMYKGVVSLPLDAHRAHFQTLHTLASHTRVFHLDRPARGCPARELSELVEATVLNVEDQ